MCARFRSVVGKEWKPGQPLPLELVDGTPAEGVWAGFATREKLAWWTRQPGNELAQGEAVAEIAERADDSGEMIWGAVPEGSRLLFVVEPSPVGKNYRLAKMVTTAATAEQSAYFRHGRYPVLGKLRRDSSIEEIAPLAPPPPLLRKVAEQGELF